MSAADDSPFRQEDFNTIRTKVTVNNTTTGTALKSHRNRIVEILEKGMSLELPSDSCAVGDYLVVKIEYENEKGEKGVFKSGAKVESIQDSSVVVSLIQFDQIEWEVFLTIFMERQNAILKFFAAAKG